MLRLTDLKPLKKLDLPGMGAVECSGLVLVVGPNSSGKSQLLRDIYHRLAGEIRKLVVATEIQISEIDFDILMATLEAEGIFESYEDSDGNQKWRPRRIYTGQGQPISEPQPDRGRGWYGSYSSPDERSGKKRSLFLNYYGRMLMSPLFLDRRLTALNQASVIDFELQPPQQDLHALYLDDEARKGLFDEFSDSFGKAVWPDTSRGNIICLRVSDEGKLPSAEERLSFSEMAKYLTIEDEGDGMKSYVTICVTLLLGRKPVCLIDEPEMCLHPPQALRLGRFIGRVAASQDTVTFVATHSSQVLRGVIQSSPNVQIVRMTRKNGEFSAHLVPAEALNKAVSKPTVRGESVLDGIFARSVVVVEGDGDRLVYQTAWETLAPEISADVHFSAVGGTGGIADTCQLYRTLKIPVAVVADLDIIADQQKLRSVMEAMSDQATIEDVLQRSRQLIQNIRNLPPTMTENEVRRRLEEILEAPLDWEGDGDIDVKRTLQSLVQGLDRVRRLKRGGVLAFETQLANDIASILNSLKQIGVFLVPVGDLEAWLADYEISVSKQQKWAWANAAALKIQEVGRQEGDIWEFVNEVAQFLESAES